MNERKSLTLKLPQGEMTALEALSSRKELSKTVLVRQALRLLEVIEERTADGQRLVFEGTRGDRSEIVVL
jgi:hypothetical protein